MTILSTLNYSHFTKMESLEKEFYNADYITPAHEAFCWYKEHKDSVIAATDSNEITGFINMFPVSDSVFSKLKSGTFNDRDLKSSDIVDINSSQNYPFHMFLSCIVIKKEYQKSGLSRLLLFEAIKRYAHKESLFDFILADTVTDDGKRFAQKYGFVPIFTTDHASTVHIQSYKDFVFKVTQS